MIETYTQHEPYSIDYINNTEEDQHHEAKTPKVQLNCSKISGADDVDLDKSLPRAIKSQNVLVEVKTLGSLDDNRMSSEVESKWSFNNYYLIQSNL